MRKIKVVFVLSVIATCFTQCKVFDNEVLVPGYVYVPLVYVETAPNGSQGDNVSQLSDIWIYSNGSVEGAFPYPALIPIQKNGHTQISIDAGVLRTGQNNERIPYPLIARYDTTVNLRPGITDTITPVFKYYENCNFLMIEDFDNTSGLRFKNYRSQAGDSIMRYDGEEARTPGKFSGQINLTDSTDDYEIITIDQFHFRAGERVFLEADYNSDLMLRFGFYATDINGVPSVVPIFYSNPTDSKWNRVYLDLSEEISVQPIGTTYTLFIRMFRTIGTPKPKVLLDNIKLIQF